jgi:two-component system NarL family sensor kinase
VRRISRNLRPSELDDLGLGPALRSLCSEFSERTSIPSISD